MKMPDVLHKVKFTLSLKHMNNDTPYSMLEFVSDMLFAYLKYSGIWERDSFLLNMEKWCSAERLTYWSASKQKSSKFTVI